MENNLRKPNNFLLKEIIFFPEENVLWPRPLTWTKQLKRYFTLHFLNSLFLFLKDDIEDSVIFTFCFQTHQQYVHHSKTFYRKQSSEWHSFFFTLFCFISTRSTGFCFRHFQLQFSKDKFMLSHGNEEIQTLFWKLDKERRNKQN